LEVDYILGARGAVETWIAQVFPAIALHKDHLENNLNELKITCKKGYILNNLVWIKLVVEWREDGNHNFTHVKIMIF